MFSQGLLDKERLLRSLNRTLYKNKPTTEKEEVIQVLWKYILRGNIKQLFTIAKTQPTLILLSALHQASLRDRIGSIYFTAQYTTTYELFEAFGKFKAEGIQQRSLEDEDTRISANIYALFYQALNLKSSYHIQVDIYLSDVIIEGKPFKADILIWLPTDPQFKLVLLFTQLHTQILEESGYQVMNINASEIKDNPHRTIKKLLEILDF